MSKTPKKEQKEDDSTQKLLFGFKKRCDNYGLVPATVIKAKLDEVLEVGAKGQSPRLQLLHVTEELGPMQVRAFMEIAVDLHYEYLKRIRIWKGAIGDQGLRMVCKYLSTSYSLQLLDLLQNQISPLGCQFLAKPLASPLCRLKQLKLDNNLILTQGLKQLTLGLRINNVLDKLSLKYCGIDGDGSKYIQEILANITSKLRSLKLQGNQMGNESIYQVLRAVQHNESLQKLNIADTGVKMLNYQAERQSSLEMLANQMVLLMTKNENILKYDIRFNPLHNEIAEQMLKAVESNPTIRKMEFPNNVSYGLRDSLDTVLRKRTKNKRPVKKPKKK